MSSVALRWDRSRGSTYGLASLEGEGLLISDAELPEDSSCAGEACSSSAAMSCIWGPSGGGRATIWEAPMPEGLAVREVPPVLEGLELPEEVPSFSKSFSLSDTTVQVHE